MYQIVAFGPPDAPAISSFCPVCNPGTREDKMQFNASLETLFILYCCLLCGENPTSLFTFACITHELMISPYSTLLSRFN